MNGRFSVPGVGGFIHLGAAGPWIADRGAAESRLESLATRSPER